MASKGIPRAGIYFSHYECFGHTAHVMAVSEVFKKKFPRGNFFFIQAGIPQREARIGELGKVCQLPGTLVDRGRFKGLPQGTRLDIQQRAQMCADIITRQRPGLFMTEFFPLGREESRYELIPALGKARVQGAVLWALAGYPLITGNDDGWREKVLGLYQQIIILSPPVEKEFILRALPRAQDRRRYADFWERYRAKIKFAGYLSPRQEVVFDDEDNGLSKPPVPRGVCRVAVVRGGGTVYPKVIAESIRASEILGKEYYFTVAAGPATTPQEWSFFKKLFGKKKVNNLSLLRAVGDYEGLIKKSDVCVSLTGYQTSVMLLKYFKKAVLVPFEGYEASLMSFPEQPARASLLNDILGAEILRIRQLTAEILAAAVRKAAARSSISVRIPQEWFAGGDFLGEELTGLFGP